MKKLNKLLQKGFPFSYINKIIDVLNNTIDFINKIISDEFKTEIVEILPEVGDVNKLYLIKTETIEETNYYDEYLWVDNKWEKIGNTKITSINKHLLVYEDNKIKENGIELNFSTIYDILTNTEDFVALVYNNHKIYLTDMSNTIISFTSNYLDNREICVEHVNITDSNEVTHTIGKGVTIVGGVATITGSLKVSDNVSIGGSTSTNKSLSFGHRTDNKNNIIASGSGSFAHGHAGANFVIQATGSGSHAEGYEGATASGTGSHAEGRRCVASGVGSHAEGHICTSSGDRAHAEGANTTAKGGTSHAEGNYCETGTNGGSAHAEGSYTKANGPASHTEGYRTITTEGGQHAQGCWNKVEGGVYAFMHGCGTSEEDRRNGFLIAGDEIYIYGVGGYDGTNYGQEGVESLRQVLTSIQVKLINF